MVQELEKRTRIDVADVLRGLAVMGIIVLHSIEHFNFYSFPDTSTQSAWLNFSDKAIWDGLFFMFGGKAYAVFALLFGFSFFIQDNNQRMRGNDFLFHISTYPLFIIHSFTLLANTLFARNNCEADDFSLIPNNCAISLCDFSSKV